MVVMVLIVHCPSLQLGLPGPTSTRTSCRCFSTSASRSVMYCPICVRHRGQQASEGMSTRSLV